MRSILLSILILLISNTCIYASDLWLTTAYCSCFRCCNKSDGIMASGRKVYPGAVACNWLPFGTRLKVGNRIYTVEDRGAKSLFGTKDNHIKHLDIYMPTHKEALRYGRRWVDVEILRQGR